MENDIWSNCKTFQPSKWGFVHIPEYHYTAEQVMISTIKEGGCLPSRIDRMLWKMTRSTCDDYRLSPEFCAAFPEYFFEQDQQDEFHGVFSAKHRIAIDHFQLFFVFGSCPETGITVKYEDYYQTEWWANLREYVIEKQCGNCCLCGGTESLQVHHKTYKRIGCESLQDLSVLCVTCHGLWHKAKKGADAYQKIQNFMTAFKELERSL